MNQINARRQIETELTELIRMAIRLGKMSEESLTRAVWALKNQNADVAREIIKRDDAIDDLASEIDMACMQFTARFQPLGEDLRTVSSLMHIAVDLERLGDYASNISKAAIEVADKELMKPLIDIPRMVDILSEMLEKSLEALESKNDALAYRVFPLDDIVDDLEKQIMRELLLLMMERPQRIEQATLLLNVARTLERAGDHITNVAERAIYIITGKTIKASAYRRPKEH
ncbi:MULTISPECIES: phosphate signaling complex protein PhoU [Aminobacterium]|jgi:phosphate transport system protein|uniref:phosphate signaling complex protein PhoU n=1 Tax=Aminobacterium TaxID=81466 RepID=UPI0016AD9A31|nr:MULTISPECIES: phosphate signaling complex protein PhoU [unclassified Aminobacterium]MDD2379715.1 phosphate signaling complex protein PhoU [Aminobacterium colombiense]MDD3768598.1 phosphate signaling complex protein PhoU [Aminobacterium colombiense]MDD4265475.1 phosphate signaling complex protein PhoU [Aminobacterium colombiense]MDD4586478.1 phosphate signaling complex protein PhoU [Aminobacterium colombiense]NLK30739.1 phosphate signaling complex protein PhoU [Aminobacterium colombiense]